MKLTEKRFIFFNKYDKIIKACLSARKNGYKRVTYIGEHYEIHNQSSRKKYGKNHHEV